MAAGAAFGVGPILCGTRSPILVVSGLVEGEAIVGILLAVVFLWEDSAAPRVLLPAWGGWLSLAGFATLAWSLVRVPNR